METRLANGARGEEKRKEKEEEGVIAERRRVTHFPTRGSGAAGEAGEGKSSGEGRRGSLG